MSQRISSRISSNAGASSATSKPQGQSRALLLFDGVCTLCNGVVNFVLDADSEGYYRLGALQSEAARPYLQVHGLDPKELNTVVLIENGRLYTRSTAALRVLRHLDAPWPLLYGLIAVPRALRDWVYDWIAENRYAWFGRREECRVPTSEEQARFLKAPLS